TTTGGARTLAVIRGLREHLGGEFLAALLPALRTEPEERRLSYGRATDLVWAFGVAGGNGGRPEGALDWSRRAAERGGGLEEQPRHAAGADDDDPERPALARRRRDLERLRDDLRAVRPALAALGDVAARVVENAPLSILWPALRAFISRWLVQPGEGPRVT